MSRRRADRHLTRATGPPVHTGCGGDRDLRRRRQHPGPYQITLAHAVLDAGAALVVGHGPHSVQAVETYRDAPILYSLGNLAFDWEPMRGRHLEGLLARATFVQGARGAHVEHVELIPTARGDDNDVRPLSGAGARRLLERLAVLSGTQAPQMTLHADTARLSCHRGDGRS